jgi:type VI protein secretion system component VasF
MVGLGTLAFATSAIAQPPASELGGSDQNSVRSQITIWQQRLSGANDIAVSKAWNSVVTHWQALQAATPAGRQEATRQLARALEALEHAWQEQGHGENDARPFFYALDAVTRMTT